MEPTRSASAAATRALVAAEERTAAAVAAAAGPAAPARQAPGAAARAGAEGMAAPVRQSPAATAGEAASWRAASAARSGLTTTDPLDTRAGAGEDAPPPAALSTSGCGSGAPVLLKTRCSSAWLHWRGATHLACTVKRPGSTGSGGLLIEKGCGKKDTWEGRRQRRRSA